jgi:hypothetical protein
MNKNIFRFGLGALAGLLVGGMIHGKPNENHMKTSKIVLKIIIWAIFLLFAFVETLH